MTQTTTAPPVVISVPNDLGPVEVCVRHESWGVEVDVRPANSRQTWTPISLMGGAFVVRAA